MSVSGDSTIMRHGRSQISIYDYPEHLNPFYEDENHKRLRFWKIGKHKDDNGRRSSFSLGGIKDMWTFKSFRLKKKSSSLGINKTSESPPPLRRQLDPSQCNYGTYDPRMRHTTTLNGANSNTFERNTPYRSSLQDMRLGPGTQQQQNGFGFARNDRYRSTVQTPPSTNYTKSPIVPPRRYVYGGSVTPQPIRNNGYKCNDDYQGISRGPSQVSVSSSNPFEDDDDDVVIRQLPNGSSTPKKRQHRKKNRAPPPPISVPVVREGSQNNAVSIESDTSHLHIEEEEEYLPIDEILNISSLTAEIESFVQTSKNDSSIHESTTPIKDTKKQTDSPSTQTFNTASSPQKNVISGDDASKCLINSNKIIVSTKTIKQDPSQSQHITKNELNNNNADEKSLRIVETKVLSKESQSTTSNVKEVETESQQILPVEMESEVTNTTTVINEVMLSKMEPKPQTKLDSEIIANGQVDNNKIVTKQYKQNPTATSQKITIEQEVVSTKISETPNKNEDNSLALKNNEPAEYVLKITENSPILTDSTTGDSVYLKEKSGKSELPLLRPKENPPKPPKPSLDILSAKKEMSKSRKEYFPLNPPKTENDLYRTNATTDGLETTAPVPRERRRSVRDIIESINRNQKLLKVNQEPDPDADANNSKYIFYTNNLNESVLKAPPRKKIDQNYRSLEESEKEIKRMLQELDTPPSGNREKLGKLENSEILDDLIDQLTNQNNDNNNANVFEKCTLKKEVIQSQSRESSPTTSNLDWNPLPKPKRTKNLSPEFKLDNNHSGNNNGHHFNYNNP